jgi:hypothetical protein
VSDPADVTPVTPQAYVRGNADRFFFSGRFTPQEAAGLLATEALLTGCRHVELRRHGSWWIIGGDREWLHPPLHRQAFEALVPFTEGGPNAVRGGILLTVFASDVVTLGHEGMHIVKGRDSTELSQFLSQASYARAVAFRQ